MNRLRQAAHTPLARRLASLTVQRRNVHTRRKPSFEPLLARAFSHPEGAGVIGPGAQRLLRTVLVNALTCGEGGCGVFIARRDLERLFGAASSRLSTRFAPVMHVTDTLEDAIERLESRPPHLTVAGLVSHKPTLWLATPGADADVVHQALENQPATDLVSLFNGPWPYGPTHFIDLDGPRRLPEHDLHLLNRDQAIAELHAFDSPL